MTTLKVGAEVAGVRIDELAGQGGSSLVYRGTELSTGNPVALKILRDPGPAARRRMKREADLLARFEHPDVVRFHALSEHDDDLMLVTEWVDGQPLRTQQRDHDGGHQDNGGHSAALAVLQAMADPLDHLHAANVVHRDVTPSNIMRTDDGSLTLIDLGIGHEVGSATLTNHDLLAGTPRYLAPEIIRGESATPQSDQYSLAVVVYELAAGTSPFPSADEIATALHHQLNTVPTPLNEVDPSIPAPFAAAIERALSKNPHQRFASVTEFASSAAGTGDASDEERRSMGRAPLVAAILVTCAVIAAAAALLLWPDGAPEAAQPAEAIAIEPVTNPAAGIWRAGDAAALTCNLLEGDDFENGSVPLDYFGNPPARERVVESGGFDDSWALEVGIENNYGQYAEIVPISDDQSYRFQGWFAADGDIEAARIGITVFDNSLVQLSPEVQARLRTEPGFSQIEFTDLPAGAAFALPWIFKDSSPGVLLADELVFGPSAQCTAEIAGS